MDYPVFKIGDKIVCINDRFDKTAIGHHLMSHWPKLFEVYTVRAIHDKGNSVFLEELINDSDNDFSEPSFFNFRFRKAIIDDYRNCYENAHKTEEALMVENRL